MMMRRTIWTSVLAILLLVLACSQGDQPQPVGPTAPTQVQAAEVSQTSLTLTWQASPSSGVVGYRVYRSLEAGTPEQVAVEANRQTDLVTATHWSQGGLSAGTTYHYVVAAVDGRGNEARSGIASVTTLSESPGGNGPDVPTAPTAPTGLEAVSGDDGVGLSWQANPEADLQAYRVYRSTLEPGEPVAVGSFDLLAEVSSSTVTYTDTALTPGTTYYYAVTAVNSAGLESAVQSVASATPQTPDTSGFTQIDWSSAAQAPLGVTEAQGTVVDGELYVMGGYTSWSPLAVTTDIYIYDPAAGALGSWRRVATSLPEPLTHAGITVDGRDIYLAGGYVGLPPGRQTFASQNVWKLNVDTLAWEAMPPLPEARGAGEFVRLGRALHYFGGSDLSRSDRVEHWSLSLDNPEKGWQTLAPLPEPRNHFGAAVLNGRIYVIGGQTGQDEAAVYHPDVFVYDPSQDSWSRAASLPSGRAHILESTFAMDGRVLVIGGDVAPYVATNEVLAYAPASDAWTALTPLPRRLEAGIAAEIDGVVYFTTGGGFSRATYRGFPIP